MESACPLLWNHFCSSVTSTVMPCCRVDQRNDLKDWETSSIQDGIHSINHIETRNLMRKGIRPQVCNVCYKQEDIGIGSSRLNYLQIYQDIDYSKEPEIVLTADIKFNNTCNLACRMCNPFSSSLIASLLKDVSQQDRIHNVPIIKQNYKEKEKLEYCKKLIKKGLKEFKTTGGEPFYQKYFIKLLDWCIRNNYNNDLIIKITTNGINLDANTINKLITFKECHLNISIDGYKNVYEYIRFPGKWSDIDTNLKNLMKHTSKTFKVNISTLLNIYNLFDIPNIENYLKSIGYNKKLTVDCFIKPYETSELNVKNLPTNVIEHAIEQNTHKRVLTYLKSVKTLEKDESKIQEFRRKTKIYDSLRNQNYKVLDPNIRGLF
jgi:molybdenum cofactor biosynthesis enzyme MoaA